MDAKTNSPIGTENSIVSWVGSADCFRSQGHPCSLGVYVRGQLSDLPEKSVEPIALARGSHRVRCRSSSASSRWDDKRARDRVQEMVRTEHTATHSIGIFDETSDPRRRQDAGGAQAMVVAGWANSNCIVTVHLGYAWITSIACSIGELFPARELGADRERCRERESRYRGVYRPKWRIALGMYDRASPMVCISIG